MAPSNRNTNRRSFGAALKRGWNSKPAGIAAVVVLVLVIIVVLISTLLGVFAPANNDEQGAASKPAPTSSPAADGPCNVKVTDTSSTPKVPSDLTWKTGQEGLTWPVSKSVGPTKTVDGFDACFARSPLGAALAATTAIYDQYGKHSAAESLNFYIADSTGKKKSLAVAPEQSDPEQMRSSGMNPAGFSIDAFTKDRVELTLVYSYPSSSTGYYGMPMTMVWVDGDWKIAVLDSGATSNAGTTPSDGDFIRWTGKTS